MRAFRAAYDELVGKGAEVLGVSSDSVASHAAFRQAEQLPFRLLSDPNDAVRDRYGVPGSFLGLVPGRVTFVIGRDRIVRDVYQAQLDFDGHAEFACSATDTPGH